MIFFIKKLISPFLMPPGLFVTIILGVSVWAFWRGKRRMLGLLLPLCGMIWLSSLGPFADMLIRPLETAYPLPQKPQGDVIIMLTGGIYDYAPDLSGTGTPGPATVERLVTAARLHRQLNIPIIVSGGRVFPGGPAISQLTKRFLVDMGIDADQIIQEDRSRDTFENAKYSKEICIRNGYTHPILVTSASHIPRAMLSCDRVDFKVTPFPCAMTTWQDMAYSWYSFLPSAGAMEKTSSALHEWLGLLFYRLKY